MVVEALQTRLQVIEDEILRLAKAGSQESEKAQQDNLLNLAHDLQREARELRAEIKRVEINRVSESIGRAPFPILLYDGVCGFCNRLVKFILRRDRRAIFRFAALQSTFAARILARHGVNPSGLDTFYVVVNPNLTVDNHNHDSTQDDSTEAHRSTEYLLARSPAVLYVLYQIGGWHRAASIFLRLIPRFLRDWGYNIIARHRYRIFGRSETCMLSDPKDRKRFLDLNS